MSVVRTVVAAPVTAGALKRAINNRKKEIRRLIKHISQTIGRCAYSFQIFSECFPVVFKYFLIRLIQRHRDYQAQTTVKKGNIMKEKTVRLSAARALELAADQAGIELANLQAVDLNVDPEGLYDIGFQDDWMKYICYIDCLTGEVRGFFTEPLDIA